MTREAHGPGGGEAPPPVLEEATEPLWPGQVRVRDPDAWSVRVEEEYLDELGTAVETLRDALTESRVPPDDVTECGVALRSAGLRTGGSLEHLAEQFTVRMGNLRGDCSRLAEGIQGVNVGFSQLEASVGEGFARIRGLWTEINGTAVDAVRSPTPSAYTASDDERGVGRLRGF